MTNTQARDARKNGKRPAIRVPQEMKDRIDRLRDELQEGYEAGRIEIPANVDPEHLPLWFVLERALDELEDHKARSSRSHTNRKTAV